jgi:AraC-like DNA-binding protein
VRCAEHAPPAELAAWVRCIWTLRGAPDATDGGDPVLPDGCVEIVLNFGDRFRRHLENGTVERQPRALIAGQITRSIAIEPEGFIDLLGIRFHPWGAAPFFRVTASEMRDRMFVLDEITCIERALRRVGDADEEHERLALVGSALAECVPKARAPHSTAAHAVALVGSGSDSVRAMASKIGTTTRAMQLAFQNEIGMSPKSLMRISRLQRAAGIARGGEPMSLSRLALAAGYYDQAHFARDCRDIAGLTPGELFGQRAELTDVFLDRGAA